MSSSQYQLYIRSSLWECQEHHSLSSISLLCNQRCRCYTQLSSSVVTSDIWWVWAIMVTWMLFVSTYVLKEARVHRHHILSHLPVRYSDFRHLFLPIDLRQVVKCYYGVFISVSIYTSFNICMLVELCILSHLIPAVNFGIYFDSILYIAMKFFRIYQLQINVQIYMWGFQVVVLLWFD